MQSLSKQYLDDFINKQIHIYISLFGIYIILHTDTE